MSEVASGLSGLVRDAIDSAKKRRQISGILKKRGFEYLGKGRWLGFKNQDIVSGLMIEGSPLDTYISTFVLPTFDKRDFITWALGKRVVNCSSDKNTDDECWEAIEHYASAIATIKTPRDLILHIDENVGEIAPYPVWVRYLCFLRLGNLTAAVKYLDVAKRALLPRGALEKLPEIEAYAVAGDKESINQVLDRWNGESAKLYGSLTKTVNVCEAM